MSKFVMKAVAAAALAVTGVSSFAAVTISANPVVPVVYAKEVTGAAPITLVSNAGSLDLVTALGYTMSPGEVRTVRFELPAGATFAAGSTVNTSLPALVPGAINGLGTNVITFSVTANGVAVPAATTITITGARTVTSTAANITAQYGLYDQPSQGIAGGATGRITGNAAPVPYISFANSYEVVAVPAGAVADVSAPTAFTRFTGGGVTANLGTLDYKLVNTVPLRAVDGLPITLNDLHAGGANGTKLVVTGDFSLAANANGTFTGDALNRVYLSNTANCTAVSDNADTVTATSATFDVGPLATTANTILCYAPRATGGNVVAPIPVSGYAASLNAVSAAPANYAVANVAAAVGSISRNGTELQSPLVQITPGYVSRIALTNTGNVLGNYTIVVRGESGAVLTTTAAGLTGTIAPGSVRVFDVSSFLTLVTGGVSNGAPRAFVTISIDRPNNDIQGVYQIVNQTSGAISNSNLIRPGLN